MKWSQEHLEIIGRLERKLLATRPENLRKQDYYDGKATVKNMGIAIPQNLIGVKPVMGWPATVVDSIAERIDFLGFSSSGDHGEVLAEIVRISRFRNEFSKALTDSLIYGVGFVEIQAHDVWDSGSLSQKPVAKAVDPLSATFEWDDNGEEVAAGLVTKFVKGSRKLRTLYLPNETWWEEPAEVPGQVEVKHTVHNRGIAGLVPILNRPRSGKARGHSEITPAIMYDTDHGVRTMLGMEYNREFYTTPQRYVENAYPETVGLSEDNTKQENRAAAWTAAMSSFVAVPPTEVVGEDDDVKLVSPKVGQFASSPPDPYIREMRMLTQKIASESSIPVEYLGFVTDNPSSAESINYKDFKLVKKSELKHRQSGDDLIRRAAPLLWHIALGVPMTEAERADLDCLWANPAIPTIAAATDAAQKWVASGLAPARSSVILDMLGLTPEQQRRLESDWARDTSRALVGDLADRAAKARAENTLVAEQASRTRAEGVSWGGDDTGDDAGGSPGAG